MSSQPMAAEQRSEIDPLSAPTLAKSEGERLVDVYHRWFEVVAADTDERRVQAYRLRYQVYCVENAFEDPADNPDGLEADAFDAHSVQSLLVHRPTGLAAGTVRLVLPRPGAAETGFAMHRVCDDPALSDPARLPPATSAEISRFTISKEFRRRREDAQYPDMETRGGGSRESEGRRIVPHMTLGLMNAIVRMSVDNGITHWCAIMQPTLLRVLARMGIEFERIGPRVSYHGRRQPVLADADALLAGIWERQPELWAVITDGGRTWPLPERLRTD